MPRWRWRSVALPGVRNIYQYKSKIFTSEEADLPPQHVANFLESVNPNFCARYLEFLIEERHEESFIYHDRLAELYLKMTIDAKKAGAEGMHYPRTSLQPTQYSIKRKSQGGVWKAATIR